MKNPLSFVAAAVCLLSLTFSIAACKGKSETSAKKIDYRLKWLYNVSVAGDIWADVHGNFEEHGLNVEVKPGGPERDAIKELELCHAQFGVASADQVVRAVSKGAPIVVLAQLFQINPLQWIYRPDRTKIETPLDLKGKVLGVTFGGNDETIMKALLARYGIGGQDVELFSVRYDYTPFYQGEVDLWPIYRNAQAVIIGDKLGSAGEAVAFFDPHEAGVTFVANSVVTTDAMVKENPEIVRRFTDALLSAWREAMNPSNADKTVETVRRFDEDTPEETVRKQLEITRNLTVPFGSFEKGGKLFGRIDVDAWKETEKIMLDQKLIPEPVRIETRLLVQ
jgi:NitT/TauT family transport system substrate-binding protein